MLFRLYKNVEVCYLHVRRVRPRKRNCLLALPYRKMALCCSPHPIKRIMNNEKRSSLKCKKKIGACNASSRDSDLLIV